MLSQVHLQNFKKFKDIRVDLMPFTVLMGENSSGKTTVLQGINFALDRFFVHNFIDKNNHQAIKIKDKGVVLPLFPGISVSDFREIFYAKKTKAKGGTIISVKDCNENIYKLQIRWFFGTFNIKCTSTIADLSHNPETHQKAPLFISGFVGLLSSEERLFPAAMQDRLRSGQISVILRNLLLDTFQNFPDAYEKLSRRLEEDFGFHLGDLDFDPKIDINITAKYNDLCESQRIALDFSASGSGFMQVLQIIAPIYRFCPHQSSIVLLDEPDAHLHPNLQSALAKTLRYIQQELGIQIIISTHSTSIIRSAEPSEVVPISSKMTENKPLSSSEDIEKEINSRIDTYDLGKSVLSGKLVFFEDTDISIFETFDKLLKTKCFSGANTVPILKGRGKDDRLPFQMKEIINNFIHRDVEIHFVRDGDGLDDVWKKHLNDYACSNNVVLHHLQKYELESYLLSPKLINRALIKKHSGKNNIPDESLIEKKLVGFLKDTISMNRYNYDDNLEDSIQKTGNLVKHRFRDYREVQKEAKRIRAQYEKYEDFESLLVAGMGKEALKMLFEWLNTQGFNISKKEIYNSILKEDIPKEIEVILNQMTSRELIPYPNEFATEPEIEADDSEEDEPSEQEELDLE